MVCSVFSWDFFFPVSPLFFFFWYTNSATIIKNLNSSLHQWHIVELIFIHLEVKCKALRISSITYLEKTKILFHFAEVWWTLSFYLLFYFFHPLRSLLPQREEFWASENGDAFSVHLWRHISVHGGNTAAMIFTHAFIYFVQYDHIC